MDDIAIRVENLGKQYHIGALQKNGGHYTYKSLRDSIASAASAPFRAARALIGRNGTQANPDEDTIWALKDVSFDVKRGDIVGVIGRNGAGKSTLLKILSRITEPTTGHIEIRGRVGSLLEVGTGFHPELSGRDNVYLNGAILGMKNAEIAKNFDAIVAFAEVEKFIDTPVKHYSSGMYLRLAFAVAAHLETEILLVDEVLAVGDQRFQEKCLGKMRDVAANGRTVFFVSHSMYSIQLLCGRALAFKAGQLTADSAPEIVIANYLGGETSSTYFPPPAPSRPSITKATVALEDQTFLLTVEFESPFPLIPPVFGFVIYNCVGAPVFGTNTRVEAVHPNPEPSNRGRFVVRIPTSRFRPDQYMFSLWLADQYSHHCFCDKALRMELRGTTGGGLTVQDHGNMYIRSDFQFENT